MQPTRLFAVALLLTLSSRAPAAEPRPAPPPQFRKLVDCRAIADAGQRLACYDREVAAVAAAEARQDIVVIDRQRIRTARRTLFGLSVPDLGIFGNTGDEEAVSRIEGRIASVGQTSEGKWTFRLEDGARWAQTDVKRLSDDPRPGQTIAIRKAAMGSFLANVNKQVAIRVKRIN